MAISLIACLFVFNLFVCLQKFGFINGIDNVNWPTYRDSKADVLSVSPSSERIEELWVV